MTAEQMHKRNVRACNSGQEELEIALNSYDWLCENNVYSDRQCSEGARAYRQIIERMIRSTMQECLRYGDLSYSEVDACREDLLAFASDFPEAADSVAESLRNLAVRLVNRRGASAQDYEAALLIHEDMESISGDLSAQNQRSCDRKPTRA
jgi:hypothetical protein